MQFWNDFVTWFNSADGQRVVGATVLPFLGIVVAGVIAALIGRSFATRVLDQQDRELKSAAIMALIGAGRKATIWSSLGLDEKQHVDSLVSEADIRVRLLPMTGANAAADWAAHELNEMKKNSATFSFQAEQSFVDYRDRLLEWQNKPKRARKLFAYDLAQWRYETDAADKKVVEEQQQWATSHVDTPVAKAAPVALATAPVTAPATAPTPASAPVAATAPVTASTPVVAPATSSFAPPPAPANPDTASVPVAAESTDGTWTVDSTGSARREDDDDDTGDEQPAGYAPVTAGTVRQRINPDNSIDEDR
ncbi:hypothetical protein [Galbitalea soli]|uniref:Uncharacterized protein n=1 Tax=Galbitalea soli TaxID=1268042 RepID=A0A7C9TSM1_9MICO|nr:hypothetical protein [Galbitalea soli]NEM91663.1 hypothetical protein [Galbitalea soli]NYJ30359.1 hypothetical protein [Galbitalea soli]